MQDYVFCVDSDGCAMDTMTYKHQLYFGPLAADVFHVSDRDSFLKEWDRVNLYSKTRGINRFVGLVKGLEFAQVENIENLKEWVNTTNSLSNQSLQKAIEQNASDDLKKALEWSNLVNQGIKQHPEKAQAFIGAKQGLAKLHELGKVCVVSSANKEAVEEEWREEQLAEHVDVMYCQESGKKEDIIARLIEQGYAKENIMMIGDSPGDLMAAEQNNVAFYPILVGDETQSWEQLATQFALDFVHRTFTTTTQDELKELFWSNLM